MCYIFNFSNKGSLRVSRKTQVKMLTPTSSQVPMTWDRGSQRGFCQNQLTPEPVVKFLRLRIEDHEGVSVRNDDSNLLYLVEVTVDVISGVGGVPIFPVFLHLFSDELLDLLELGEDSMVVARQVGHHRGELVIHLSTKEN